MSIQLMTNLVGGGWRTPISVEFPPGIEHLGGGGTMWDPSTLADGFREVIRDETDLQRALLQSIGTFNAGQDLHPTSAHIRWALNDDDGQLVIVADEVMGPGGTWQAARPPVLDKTVELDLEGSCNELVKRIAGYARRGEVGFSTGSSNMEREECTLKGRRTLRQHLRSVLDQAEELEGVPLAYALSPQLYADGESCGFLPGAGVSLKGSCNLWTLTIHPITSYESAFMGSQRGLARRGLPELVTGFKRARPAAWPPSRISLEIPGHPEPVVPSAPASPVQDPAVE